MMHENDSGGLKDVNVITKFKQETHEKRATSVGSIAQHTLAQFMSG